MSKSENEAPAPHVALFPCAGMGHLIPFLRLAAQLHTRGCAVTVITVEPTVSAAESNHLSSFFSTFPRIKRLEFRLLPHQKSELTNDDPFFIQMERIGNSVHLLQPLLSSLSPPLSAAVVDLPVLSRLASALSLPIYTLITTSARFFSLMASLSHLQKNADSVEIPNFGPIPFSNVPPPMLEPNHFFAASITTNTSSLSKSAGVIINTFTSLESQAIEALRRNGVDQILPIGPLPPFSETSALDLPWLDKQATSSVLYISFGSRTALSKEQITELASALEISGCKFLWVLKGGKVDREDKEEVGEMVGAEFMERTKGKGKVIKGWVEQEQILSHSAIGGFVSHCGWNSVTEAAAVGVPVLAWPLHGDQRVNAAVVEEVGLGIWVREWGWGGERLIGRDEIAKQLRMVMGDERLRKKAEEVKKKAREAGEINGSSESLIRGLMESFKRN